MKRRHPHPVLLLDEIDKLAPTIAATRRALSRCSIPSSIMLQRSLLEVDFDLSR